MDEVKRYQVNEVFKSIQGEGLNVGRSAVFLRFAGCNLDCPFCDSDHTSRMSLTASQLNDLLQETAGGAGGAGQGLVITGGEPALQLDEEFYRWCIYGCGWAWVDIETNGEVFLQLPQFPMAPSDNGWALSVSPKTMAAIEGTQWYARQYKILVPAHLDLLPAALYVADESSNTTVFVQPVWSSDPEVTRRNTMQCVEIVKQNPKVRLSLQTHKLIAVP